MAKNEENYAFCKTMWTDISCDNCQSENLKYESSPCVSA